MRALSLMVRTTVVADRVRAWGTFGVGAFESVCRVAFAFWIGLFVSAAAQRNLAGCVAAAVGYGVCLALVGVTNMFRVSWTTVLQEKLAFHVDQELMRLSAGLPEIEHHERPEYLDRMSLIREDRAELGNGAPRLVALLQALVALLVTVGLLASVNPWLVLLLVFAAPSVLANRRIAAATEAGTDRASADLRLAQHLSDVGASPGAGKEIRVFGLEGELLRRYAGAWSRFDRTRSAAERQAALLGSVGVVIFGLGYSGALALVVVANSDQSSAVRAGQIALAFTAAAQISQLVTTTGFTLTAMSRSLAGYRRLLWLRSYASGVRERLPAAVAPVPDRISAGITFHDVGFAYPGTGRQVLSGVDLTIPAGCTLAVVGDNGAGKSTLVKLLARLYRPTEGRITVDGVDLSALDVELWRARISAGFQDFMRFEFVAGETVGVGDLDRVEDRPAAREALERAQSADVIGQLPSGLDSQLGTAFPHGVEPSGGQWQKLALGRAMMRSEPLLLLLDEPTASLDPEAEHRLFEAQSAAARALADRIGAITVLVSHRFSTTRTADLILVLEGGRVAQYGSHDQLLSAGGLYAELYALQAQAYG